MSGHIQFDVNVVFDDERVLFSTYLANVLREMANHIDPAINCDSIYEQAENLVFLGSGSSYVWRRLD